MSEYRCEKWKECKAKQGASWGWCVHGHPHGPLANDSEPCRATDGIIGATCAPIQETSAEMLVKDVQRLEAKIDDERRAFAGQRDAADALAATVRRECEHRLAKALDERDAAFVSERGMRDARDEAIRRWQAICGRLRTMAHTVGLDLVGDWNGTFGDGLEQEVAKLQDFQLHHAKLHADDVHRLHVQIDNLGKQITDARVALGACIAEDLVYAAKRVVSAAKEADARARSNTRLVREALGKEWTPNITAADIVKDVQDLRRRSDSAVQIMDEVKVERDAAMKREQQAVKQASELWAERDRARAEAKRVSELVNQKQKYISTILDDLRREECEHAEAERVLAETEEQRKQKVGMIELLEAEVKRLADGYDALNDRNAALDAQWMSKWAALTKAERAGYIEITPTLEAMVNLAPGTTEDAMSLVAVLSYLIDVAKEVKS